MKEEPGLPEKSKGAACSVFQQELELRELCVIQCDRQICVTRFSPCGKYLFAGGYDASLRRWDITGEKPRSLDNLDGHHGWVQWMEFHPGGELLYSVDSWGGLRATRYAEEKPAAVWSHCQAHDGWIRALSLCANGKLIATGGRDRCARVWSAADGKLLHEFPAHPEEVYAVALHPDAKTLVTGDLFGVLRRWDLASGTCLGEKKLAKMHFYDRIQDVGGLRLLRFQDDGQTLTCAGAEPEQAGLAIAIPTIHRLAWPSLDIEQSARFGPNQHGFLFDLAWHPGGYWAAVSSGQPGNGQLLLIRPGEDAPFFLTTKMLNCHSVDSHPDGRIAVAATNGNSQGNGAVKDKDGDYLGNWSPIHLYAPPAMPVVRA